MIEFFQSSGVKKWTDTGLNGPHYPLMFRVWWPNLDKAIQGKISPQQAMDNIAKAQDEIMASLTEMKYRPQLNPISSEQYWLAQPGAPKPVRPRETPKTLPYSQAIKLWQKVQ